MLTDKDNLKSLINQIQIEKKERFNIAIQIINGFERSLTNFQTSTATIAASVGAFSFVIFNDVANKNLLIIGDVILLVTIFLSLFNSLDTQQRQYKTFHDTYYDLFERDTIMIERLQNLYNTSSDMVGVNDYLIDEIKKISPYKRPTPDSFWWATVNLALLFTAFIFIIFSFWKY